MKKLNEKFEAETGYASWINSEIYPDGKIHTQEYVKWLESKVENLPISDKKSDEPYFGWCNVEGCENEGANGGGCWRDTGYWTVCSKHASEYRAGKPQPQMKQWAIDREKRRGKDGVLVNQK